MGVTAVSSMTFSRRFCDRLSCVPDGHSEVSHWGAKTSRLAGMRGVGDISVG